MKWLAVVACIATVFTLASSEGQGAESPITRWEYLLLELTSEAEGPRDNPRYGYGALFHTGDTIKMLAAGNLLPSDVQKKVQQEFVRALPELGIRRFQFDGITIDTSDLLNALGEAGWELVTYDKTHTERPYKTQRDLYFKRPLK